MFCSSKFQNNFKAPLFLKRFIIHNLANTNLKTSLGLVMFMNEVFNSRNIIKRQAFPTTVRFKI
jgi:hypothetical protein